MIQLLFSKLNNISIFPYYIITPCIYAIGSAAEAILYCHLKTSKKILIIKLSFFSNFLEYKICNDALFDKIYKKNNELNIIDKFFKAIIRFLIEVEFIFVRFFLLQIKKKFKYKLAEEMGFPTVGVANLYDIDKINYKNFHIYEYNSIEKLKNKRINLDIKIDKNTLNFLKKNFLNKIKNKYICIHVRDNKFREDVKRREYRNSNINNYIQTIKFLIKNGYTVVRMGSPNSNKINFKHKNFIDYSNIKFKNDILDLYLIKNCYFFIGTQSGIYDVARLFNKPILITNMVNLFSSYCMEKSTRGIFKTVRYKKKTLKIEDYCKLAFYDYLTEYPKKEDLEYIENTSTEIKNSTKEYLQLCKFKNFKLGKVQKKNNYRLKKVLKKIFYDQIKKKNILSTDLSQRQIFKMIRYFKGCNGSFTNSYLGL